MTPVIIVAAMTNECKNELQIFVLAPGFMKGLSTNLVKINRPFPVL